MLGRVSKPVAVYVTAIVPSDVTREEVGDEYEDRFGSRRVSVLSRFRFRIKTNSSRLGRNHSAFNFYSLTDDHDQMRNVCYRVRPRPHQRPERTKTPPQGKIDRTCSLRNSIQARPRTGSRQIRHYRWPSRRAERQPVYREDQ